MGNELRVLVQEGEVKTQSNTCPLPKKREGFPFCFFLMVHPQSVMVIHRDDSRSPSQITDSNLLHTMIYRPYRQP